MAGHVKNNVECLQELPYCVSTKNAMHNIIKVHRGTIIELLYKEKLSKIVFKFPDDSILNFHLIDEDKYKASI